MTSRPLEVGRGLWGLALVVAPRRVVTAVPGVGADPRALGVARVLGARHLAQAVLSGVRPGREVLALGVWGDVAHASTAVGLAALDRRRARAGLLDAAVALTWAGFGLHDLRRWTPDRGPARRTARDSVAAAVLRRLPGGRAVAAAGPR